VGALREVVENASGYYHSVVRAAACAALGQIRDASAVPSLVVAVRDPMAEASAEAVRALAVLGDGRAIEPLVAVLRNEKGYYLPVVRLAAVTALRQFAAPVALAAVRAVAGNPAESAVMRAAAGA
jgi:HEAT repeat protein